MSKRRKLLRDAATNLEQDFHYGLFNDQAGWTELEAVLPNAGRVALDLLQSLAKIVTDENSSFFNDSRHLSDAVRYIALTQAMASAWPEALNLVKSKFPNLAAVHESAVAELAKEGSLDFERAVLGDSGISLIMHLLLRNVGSPDFEPCQASKLRLKGCDINDPGAIVLFKSLGNGALPLLCQLMLDCNAGIGLRGFQEMTRVSSGGAMARLTHLWMNDITMGDAALEEVLKAVAHMPKLEELCLNGCGVSSIGAVAFARFIGDGAVPFLPALVRLNLNFNQICNDGLVALSKALEGSAMARCLSSRTVAHSSLSMTTPLSLMTVQEPETAAARIQQVQRRAQRRGQTGAGGAARCAASAGAAKTRKARAEV